MRPYQIVAAERILQRVVTSTNMKQLGTIAAGGYIWHTTGSGKTLTSFKTAQLASQWRASTRSSSWSTARTSTTRRCWSTTASRKTRSTAPGRPPSSSGSSRTRTHGSSSPPSRSSPGSSGTSEGHEIFDGHVVVIFDECHRSQFGDMGAAIRKAFKRYHLFGFTGTPIFPENAGPAPRKLDTTEAVFGDRLHTYTIVDAINDGNVLPFRVSYQNTVKVLTDLPTRTSQPSTPKR